MKKLVILATLIIGFSISASAQTAVTPSTDNDPTAIQATQPVEVIAIDQVEEVLETVPAAVEAPAAKKCDKKKCDGKKACCKAKKADGKKCEKKCSGHDKADASATSPTGKKCDKKKCDGKKKECCKKKKADS